MRTTVSVATVGWMVVFMLFMPARSHAQFVGAAKCRVCHLPQLKSWEQTKMAKAFDLLKPGAAAEAKRSHKLDPDKDYTHDPNCISCHVTGYGEPGGFVSVGKTPNLVGVQCEACHGPGEGYLKPNRMSFQNKEYKRGDLVAAGMVIPSAETCQRCHNQKSPFYKPFDFKARVGQGTHAHEALKYKHD